MSEVVSPIFETKQGIDGIKLVLQEIKEITAQVKTASADGLNLEDVKEIPALVKNLGELVAALKQAQGEVSDLDASEWKELAIEAINLVTFIMELFGKIEAVEGGEHGIQAIKDCLDVCKELAKCIKEVLADGKIGIGDIKEVPGLLSNMNVLFATIKLTGPELKELDAKEIKELAVEAIELVLFVIGMLGLGV